MYVDFSMYRYIYNRFAFRQAETVSAEERNGPRSSLCDSRTCVRLSAFGFRVSGFGFQFWGFGSRLWALGFGLWAFGVRLSPFGVWLSALGLDGWGVRFALGIVRLIIQGVASGVEGI